MTKNRGDNEGSADRDVNAEAWTGNPERNNPESTRREAQDRARGRGSQGQAESPVDSMHVDAPKQKDNARGHREGKHRR